MTVREYFLKFVKLSRYTTSLISNSRDEMSRFLIGIIRGLEEECRSTMFLERMDLSMLMVHVQKVEYCWKKRSVRDVRRLNLFIRQVLVIMATGTTSASMSSLD